MKLALSTIAVGLLLGSTGVSAQSVNIGPGGISVDPRTPRERAIDREIRREERWRERERYERRRDWRAERGIFLVLWFGGAVALTRWPAGIDPPSTPQELREALCARSRASQAGRVDIVVLDLTRPEPNSNGEL